MKPLQKNLLIELYRCRQGALDDVDELKELMLRAAAATGAIIRRSMVETCPTGIHGYVIISTSHLAVRTWPASGFALIDISTCGDLQSDDAIAIITDYFKPEMVQSVEINGGTGLVDINEDHETFRKESQTVTVSTINDECRVYLNGELQFSSIDELRYNECMVVPALSLLNSTEHALILGGGFGMSAREILRFGTFNNITLVDIDEDVLNAGRTHPEIVKMNQGSLTSPKVRVVKNDAFNFIKTCKGRYDMILCDLPEPTSPEIGRLYSLEFLEVLADKLTPGGILVTHGTSPIWSPKTFGAVITRLKSLDFQLLPYHADIPTFGDWGFIIASKNPLSPDKIVLPTDTRYLTTDLFNAMTVFGKDTLAAAANDLPDADEPLDICYIKEQKDCVE